MAQSQMSVGSLQSAASSKADSTRAIEWARAVTVSEYF